MMAADPVQRFPLNTKGRDWILGDIHGAFDLVWMALQKVGWNRANDRIFVVGDLVDRGKQSLRAHRFLDLAHVVRGNHEDEWLEAYRDGPPDPAVVEVFGRLQNLGVQWWLDAEPAARDGLVTKFAALPLAIEIETTRGRVGIVHADVPRGMTWQDFTTKLRAGDTHTIKTALWGRTRLKTGDDSGVVGIGRVYAGHTPQFGSYKRQGNVYALDTGAIFAEQQRDEGHLTIMDAIARTGPLRLPEVRELLQVVDEPADDGVPFGDYARPV